MRIHQAVIRAGFAILALACTGISAWAQAPEPHSVGTVTYVAGGVGTDEVAAMKAQASAYSALIEFAEVEPGVPHGNWTADIAVDVKAGSQLLASINVPGPILLLRLAPGRYTLEATHADVKLTKSIEVKAKGPVLRERFVWRAAAGTLGNDLRN